MFSKDARNSGPRMMYCGAALPSSLLLRIPIPSRHRTDLRSVPVNRSEDLALSRRAGVAASPIKGTQGASSVKRNGLLVSYISLVIVQYATI